VQKRPDREFCTPAFPASAASGPALTNTITVVTRGATRSIALLTATVFVALLLAACGGSDSGSSDSSSTAGSATTEAQESGAAGSPDGQSGTEGENDAGSGQPASGNGDESSTGFTAEEVETPLEVSGGGAEQFRTEGGDNSIQEFGEESDESELQEAAEIVHSFFVARATGDWAGACSYLSKSMSEQLERLAASSTELEDKGCASFLEAFTGHLSASEWRQITTVDAGSLRQEDEQAFLIYYGPDKAVYAMPLAVEDGQFKVGALSGDALS
jgi:hypothetical protein